MLQSMGCTPRRRFSFVERASGSLMFPVALALSLCLLPGMVWSSPAELLGGNSFPTEKQIQHQIEELAKNPLADSAESQRLTEALTQTSKELANLDTQTNRLNLLTEANPESTLASLREQTLASPTPGPAPFDNNSTLAELDQLLENVHADQTVAANTLAAIEDESLTLSTRRSELASKLSDARLRQSELARQLLVPEDPNRSARVSAAERTLLQIRNRAALTEIALLEEEQNQYDPRREILSIRKDLVNRRIQELSSLAAAVDTAISAGRQRDAEAAAQDARQARKEAAKSHPVVLKIADENARIAEERTGSEGIIAKIDDSLKRLNRANGRIVTFGEDFANIRKRLQTSHVSATFGLLLIKKREEYSAHLRAYQKATKAVQEELPSVQYRLLDLEDARTELSNINAAANEYMREVGPDVSEDRRLDILSVVTDLVRVRRSLLDSLIEDYNNYFQSLVDRDAAYGPLLTILNKYLDFISENILWVRNSPPITRFDARKFQSGIVWMVSPVEWMASLRGAYRNLSRSQVIWLLVPMTVLCFGYIRLRRYFQVMVGELGRRSRFGEEVSVAATYSVLGQTVVMTSFWPLVLWVASIPLGAAPHATIHGVAVSRALVSASLMLALCEGLRQLCRKLGLADAHFHWPIPVVTQLRKTTYRCLVVLVPLQFVSTFALHSADVGVQDSLGRILSLVTVLFIFGFLYEFFHPSSYITSEIVDWIDSRWVDRLRSIGLVLVLTTPTAVVIALCLGYTYTANHIELRFMQTVWLAVISVVVHSLLSRSIVVWNATNSMWLGAATEGTPHSRITKEGFSTKGRNQFEDEGALDSRAGSLDAAPTKAKGLSPELLNAQSRRVLAFCLGMTLIIGTMVIWQDVVPALGILDRVKLWDISTSASEMVRDPDGVVSAQVVTKDVAITLKDALLAAIILLLTWLTSGLIPEIADNLILKHLPIETGGRYTLKALANYAFGAIGGIMSLATLGLSWNNVQWLAAAISVGLGFGLQEIFANFVSGLILLFERPIRVGDIITIGDITGTVEKIKIRATTIVNFERKELIVPNREFITGKLVNWTLTDTVLRLDFPVGVAYGSDTRKVVDSLERVARAHPKVLKNPAPSVVFQAFGASSLDFELRVFINDMDVLIRARHDINMMINDEFARQRIVIAFPQQDIHVRSIDVPIPFRNEGEGAAKLPSTDEQAEPPPLPSAPPEAFRSSKPGYRTPKGRPPVTG